MTRSIAVGVGGLGGWRALAWAADEAERTGAFLTMVNVSAPGSPLHRFTTPTPAEVEPADPPLARAYATTRARLGGHRVRLRIANGKPFDYLVDASVGVQLLVIGCGGSSRTARHVLRHAWCPVVVVRPETPPLRAAPLADHIVIGVDGSPAGRMAQEFAFTHAAEHRLPLAVVHVSRVSRDDYFYDGGASSPHFAAEPAALGLLADETESWAKSFPALPIRRAVLHGSVAEGLIRASAGAHLLVLGNKHRGFIGRARTGDVPLAVATAAYSPVAVVPLEQREGIPL